MTVSPSPFNPLLRKFGVAIVRMCSKMASEYVGLEFVALGTKAGKENR